MSDAETGVPVDSARVHMSSGRIFVDEEGHGSVLTDADGLYAISSRFEDECPGDLRTGALTSRDYRSSASADLECTGGTRQVHFELTPFDRTGENVATAD